MNRITPEGDLIAHAKRLIEDGLYEPAVVTARVALERTLRGILEANRDSAPKDGMIGCRRLARTLRHHKRISCDVEHEVSVLNMKLSRIAHGYETTAHEATHLVERTGRCVEAVRASYAKHLRRREARAERRARDLELSRLAAARR